MNHKEQIIKELLEELKHRKSFGVSAFANVQDFHEHHKALKEVEDELKKLKTK